ncbi:hypothetical protein E3A20_27700, partial [Planctomyces bekefii]
FYSFLFFPLLDGFLFFLLNFFFNFKTITSTSPLSLTLSFTLNNFYYLYFSLLSSSHNPFIPFTFFTTFILIYFFNYIPSFI